MKDFKGFLFPQLILYFKDFEDINNFECLQRLLGMFKILKFQTLNLYLKTAPKVNRQKDRLMY